MGYEKRQDIDQRVYSAEDIQVMLGVKRSAAYNFLTKVYKDGAPFLVLKIVSMYSVPKESFDEWLCGKEK